MKNLISIISPVYNCEKYLKDFIDSIKKQTYSNFEVILVDDGSTDNSKKVIEKNIKDDKRFKYFYKENEGAPKARNLGIEKAVGDIIYIPDSDDIINSNTLQLFVDEINKGNDIVMGNYETFINDIGDGKCVDVLELDYQYDKIEDYMFAEPFPGNKCYKASLIKDNNVIFDDVKIAQDLNFYLKCLVFAKKISCIEDIVYYYRITPNSISRKYSFKIFDIVNSIGKVEEFYRKNKVSNMYIDNLEFIKLFHYYGQFVKINNFEKKEDKKKIYRFFKERFTELKVLDKKDFYLHKERYDNYKKRLKYDFILSSNLYRKHIRKILRGNNG